MMDSTVATQRRIKLLSADIASKIAAGEVVERPASVLKELLENSIDAGATKIAVTIENGGIKNISVTDNGSGILREDLELALQQHATSKITQAQDLVSITSLGFRGEALASINSVAKLSITSQTAEQEHAWCINQQGIVPAAHPVGTTIAMQDLFYNVPARRKFLRSERTEYLYLEEVFRRIALSNFDVGFSLTHQGKLLKNLPACKDLTSQTRRLVSLCGKQVITNAITIDAEQNGMRLWGWLGSIAEARSQEPHQYFFINKRVIKDRLINHAIRQVYQPLCAEGKMPFYCLYLELDPVALDVNVHPTKHEVRFRDARIIHAFITQILSAALHEQHATSSSTVKEKFSSFMESIAQAPATNSHRVLFVLANKIIVAQIQEKLILVDAAALRTALLMQQLHNTNASFILQEPYRISIRQVITEDFLLWCKQFAFEIEPFGPQNLILRAVPKAVASYSINWDQLLPQLIQAWNDNLALQAVFIAITKAINYDLELTNNIAEDLLLHLENLPNVGLWREFSVSQVQQLLAN